MSVLGYQSKVGIKVKIRPEHLESVTNEEIFDKDALIICEQGEASQEMDYKKVMEILTIHDIL